MNCIWTCYSSSRVFISSTKIFAKGAQNKKNIEDLRDWKPVLFDSLVIFRLYKFCSYNLQLYRFQITIKNISLFLLPTSQQYTATASGPAVVTANSAIDFYTEASFLR